jgi:hypothetical protein
MTWVLNLAINQSKFNNFVFNRSVILKKQPNPDSCYIQFNNMLITFLVH